MGWARLAEFWQQARTRLDTARMTAILGGAGRVYLATEDYTHGFGEAAMWGRVVIVPATTAWPGSPVPAEDSRSVAFLVRSEFNNFREPGYDVIRSHEAAQDEARARLHRWAPDGTAFDTFFAVHQVAPPQPLPMWDETRNLWLMSSEYRYQATASPAVKP